MNVTPPTEFMGDVSNETCCVKLFYVGLANTKTTFYWSTQTPATITKKHPTKARCLLGQLKSHHTKLKADQDKNLDTHN